MREPWTVREVPRLIILWLIVIIAGFVAVVSAIVDLFIRRIANRT